MLGATQNHTPRLYHNQKLRYDGSFLIVTLLWAMMYMNCKYKIERLVDSDKLKTIA